MSTPKNSSSAAQRLFAKPGNDESLAKNIAEKSRAAGLAQMARLREQRLAKEAADKAEAEKLASDTPVPSSATKRARKETPKPPKMMRMTY